MTQNRWLCLIATGALAALSACSSSESASEEYAQPAASQGDEATPPEAMPAAATPAAATPAAATPPERDTQSPAPNPNAGPSENMPRAAMEVAVSATPTAVAGPGGESLRDAQIVHVTESADQAEVEQATVARSKARDARVKAFAERMFEQHTRARQESAELARKANITPEDSRVAGELQAKAKTALQLLRTIDASQFDATYLNSQVQQHEDLLKLLDEQLIPSASDANLKAALRDTRSLVARHLNDAKELATKTKR